MTGLCGASMRMSAARAWTGLFGCSVRGGARGTDHASMTEQDALQSVNDVHDIGNDCIW
jgi:hypothetical protein